MEKKLHIDADMVIQSSAGALVLISDRKKIKAQFENWTTLSAFFHASNNFTFSPRRLLAHSSRLAQSIELSINGKPILVLQDGSLTRWKLFPLIRLVFLRWRTR